MLKKVYILNSFKNIPNELLIKVIFIDLSAKESYILFKTMIKEIGIINLIKILPIKEYFFILKSLVILNKTRISIIKSFYKTFTFIKIKYVYSIKNK
ncbi:MAG: hypothetical protein N2749_05940 [Clostridia bacterium]|nr:hypothetical protein [Clostridia bacterium]